MASKQEKLAAARKKLKEFQGRHRESENLKQTIVPEILSPVQTVQNSNLSIESSPSHTPVINDQNFDHKDFIEKIDSYGLNETKCFEHSESDQISDFLKKSSQSFPFWPDEAVNTNSNMPSNNKTHQDFIINKSGLITPEINFNKIAVTHSSNNYSEPNISLCQNQFKNLNTTAGVEANTTFSEVIKPLQSELQNHAQTINILIEQRNEAQAALAIAQNALSKKSDEISRQAHQISSSTLAINELTKRLEETDQKAKSLNFENEKKIQQINEFLINIQALKSQLESKDEEYVEIKKKYDEKCKEYQDLLHNLNETQSQLSFSQIELQKHIYPVVNEKSELMLKISNLENDNVNLQQKIQFLTKELEVAKAENEHSSQNFKVYVQQCNSEIEALNSQVKVLTASNEELKEINKMAHMNKAEEVVLNQDNTECEDSKNEIINLNCQINELTKAKDEILLHCQKLEEENSELKQSFGEKETELTNVIKVLENENKKLLLEIDSCKGNQRLLAAIESEKVAAAKAVAQNQKLKNQVIELEEAFVRLNEEKLELTNQLSHEKHMNKELNNRMENLELQSHEKDHNCDSHREDIHNSICDESNIHAKDINNSKEIDELRRIIRQLQDDKMELKSRINSASDAIVKKNDKKDELEKIDDEKEDQESAKLRLQQMEEKLRKTMNEIAALDEEKEKLEHLVLQLQGETETIGEYITLYQKQRMLLKQRSHEKDIQLLQLSKDKEELKTKLNSLDELIQNLLREKNGYKLLTDGTSLPENEKFDSSEDTESTASKIRILINEIGSSNLISSKPIAFTHCACCSGRLINV